MREGGRRGDKWNGSNIEREVGEGEENTLLRLGYNEGGKGVK